MRLVNLIVLLLLQCIFLVTDIHAKQAKFKVSSYQSNKESKKASEYLPIGKEIFRFKKKAKKMQEFGFEQFCSNTKTPFCSKNARSYKKYVGMKGYFLTKEPIKKDKRGYGFYPILLENGEKYYFVAKTKYGDKYRKSSPIVSVSKPVIKFVGTPLYEKSKILISTPEKHFTGTNIYKLSNGMTIAEPRLVLIRKLALQYGDNHEIAELLLYFTINDDDIENRIFISPKGTILVSGIKLYIKIHDDQILMRYKVKYYGDDWLFVNSYIVAADDYRWYSPKIKFTRDNSGGNVWEWIDIPAVEQYIDISQKMAGAKSSKIRFQGDKYYSDYELKDEQKDNLSRSLKLFSLLNSYNK